MTETPGARLTRSEHNRFDLAQPEKQVRQAAYRRGWRAEALVAWWYRVRGYRVLARRYKTAVGEVDLVLLRFGVLVFVEVKARVHPDLAKDAVAAEAVNRIGAAADVYLAANHNFAGYDVRFDLVSVSPNCRITRMKNAL